MIKEFIFSRYIVLSLLVLSHLGLSAQLPMQPVNGYQLFVKDNAVLQGSEIQGSVAIGADLKLNGNLTIASQNAGTFKIGNLPIGLLVGGKTTYGSGVFNINSNAYVKIGDCTGSKIWYKDNNGASSNLRINDGSSYNSSSFISLQTNANSLGVSELVNPVCQSNLIDYEGSFKLLRENSLALATCNDNVNLRAPNGNLITDYNNLPNQVNLKLTNPVNTITLPINSINGVLQFVFDGVQPNANNILIINVTYTGSGTPILNGFKNDNLQQDAAKYILYNFYNISSLVLNPTRQLFGTIFAPFAEVDKQGNSNIFGQLVATAFTMSGGSWNLANFSADVAGCTTGGGCPKPNVLDIVGPTEVCPLSSVQYSNSTPNGIWVSSDTNLAKIDQTGKLTSFKKGDLIIYYSVSNSCGTTTQLKQISILDAPIIPQINSDSSTKICVGSSIVLQSSLATGNQWYLDGLSIAAAVNQNLTVNQPGIYTVKNTNAKGCESLSSNPVLVSYFNLADKPVVLTQKIAQLCAGDSLTLISSYAEGNQWYRNGQIINGAINQSLIANVGGYYAVKARDANGCQTSLSDSVVINFFPVVIVSAIVGPNVVCTGNTVKWTNPTPGGQWISDDANIASVDAVTGEITGINAGTTTIRYFITDANGCSSLPNAAKAISVVKGPDNPFISMGGPTFFCQGDSVILTANHNSVGNLSFQWIRGDEAYGIYTDIPGETKANYTAKQNGYYSVRVTNSLGCSNTSAENILVSNSGSIEKPVISASGPTAICGDGNVTLTASPSAAKYYWYKDGVLINGAVNQSYLVSLSGKYQVVEETSFGCISPISDSIVVTKSNIPAKPTIIPDGVLNFCGTGSVELTSSAADTYRWIKDNKILDSTRRSIIVKEVGAYKVLISINGCSGPSSDETIVTAASNPPAAVISVSGNTNICQGSSVTLTSNATSGNQWYFNNLPIPGANSQTYTARIAGSYTVQYSTSSGCKSEMSQPVSISIAPLPEIPQITTNGPTNFCVGNNVTFTLTNTGITPVVAYQWYFRLTNSDEFVAIPGATSQTYTATLSGQYTGEVYSAAGCVTRATKIWEVRASAAPSKPIITANGPTSFCEGGLVKLTSDAGTPTRWLKNNGPYGSGGTVPVMEAGSYVAYVTDANSCTATSDPIVITVNVKPSKPSISTSDPTSFCAIPGAKATLTSSASSGNQWYLDGVAIVGATGQTYTATGSGNYTVAITNASACSSEMSDGIQISANPPGGNPIIYALSNTNICQGSSVVLASSIAVGNQWYKDGVAIVGATARTYAAQVSGVYTLTVNDLANCVSGTSAGKTVVVNALPSVPSITGPSSVCVNNSITLANATTGGVWSSSDTKIANIDANTGLVTGVTAGTVSIVYTVTNGSGCVGSNSQTITVNNLPIVADINGPAIVCVAASINLSNTTAGGVWSSSDPSKATVSNTGLVTGLTPGLVTINYAVTNNAGCTTTVSFTIKVAPKPIVGTISGVNNVCVGNNIILSNSTVGGVWSTDNPAIALVNVSGEVTGVAQGTAIVSYIITDANGCSSAPNATKTILVNPVLSIPDIAANGPTQVCQGGSVVLSSSVPGGSGLISYQWLKTDNPANAYLPIAGAISQNYTATTTGFYKVVVSNASGCSSTSSKSIRVLINELPSTPSITANGPISFCSNETLTLTATSANSYQWYKNGIAINNEVAQTISVNSTGNYQVQAIDLTGCVSALSNSIAVQVNPVPSKPTINATGPLDFCKGNTVLLQSSTAEKYQWFLNKIAIAGATTSSISASRSGSYSVKVSSLLGCSSDESKQTTVNVYPVPEKPYVTVEGPTVFCSGTTVKLTSTATEGNQWFRNSQLIDSAKGQTLQVNQSGNYSVNVKSAFGCISLPSNSISITVNQLPATPVISASGPTSFCKGGSVNLISNINSGIQWFKNGVAIPDQTGVSLLVSSGGTYTCQSTNASNCSSGLSNTIFVTVNSLPDLAPISGDDQLCVGSNTQLTNANGGGLWSSSDPTVLSISNTGLVTALKSGTAIVRYTLTNVSGCISFVEKTILVLSTPALPKVKALGPNSFCKGNSVVLVSSTINGNQWLFNGNPIVGEQAQFLRVTESGNYSVSVTNASGCVSNGTSNAIAVVVNDNPSKPVISANGNSNFCKGGSVTLSSNQTNGNQWYLNGSPIIGANGQNFIATVGGTYTLIVTNNSGCSSIESNQQIVTVNPIPETPIILSKGNNSICQGESVILVSNASLNNQWYRNGVLLKSETNPTLKVQTTGDYQVGTSSLAGCNSGLSNVLNVTVNNLPVVTPIVGASEICVKTITQFTNATNAGTWSSSNLSIASVDPNTGLVNGIDPGICSIIYTVTNASGCSTAVNKQIKINAAANTPIISVSGETNFCNGDSVVLSSTTGATYQWFLNGVLINGQTQRNLVAKLPGSYTVLVTNGSGCSSVVSAPILVIVNALPNQPSITTSGPTSFCQGGSVTLFSSASSSNQWFKDGIPISNGTSTSIAVNATGVYAVQTSNLNGCKSVISNPLNVQVFALPILGNISGPSTVCAGTNTTYTNATAGGVWASSNSAIASINNAGLLTAVNAGFVNISYTLTDVNACTAKTNLLVKVRVTPDSPYISVNTSTVICAGGTVELASNATAGNQWLFNGSPIPGAVNQLYQASQTGNYSVRVNAVNSCINNTTSLPVAVTVNNLPNPGTIVGPSSLCLFTSTTLTNTVQGGVWSSSNKDIIEVSQLGQATANAVGNAVITYTIQNASGCSSSTSITINVLALPNQATISPNGPTNFCRGGSVILSSSSGNGYQWYKNGILIPNANSQQLLVSTAGNYHVQVTNANGCVSPISNKVLVTVYATLSSPSIISTPISEICDGNEVILESSSNSSNQWYRNGSILLGETNKYLSVKVSGDYAVQLVDSNGCISSNSNARNIIVNPIPNPAVISALGPLEFCAGNNVLISATVGEGYKWFKNGQVINNATLKTINVISSGTYYAQLVSSKNCISKPSNALAVIVNTVPKQPEVIASRPTIFCLGDSTTLSASIIGDSYQWYLNNTPIAASNSQTIIAKTSGNYSVEVKNSNGCQSLRSKNLIVLVQPIPSVPVITPTGPLSICAGQSILLTSSSNSNRNEWYSNGGIMNGFTSNSINAIRSGSYSSKAINAFGCVSQLSNQVVLQVNSLPDTPVITAKGPTTFCVGGSVVLEVTPIFSSYQWFRNNVLIQGANTANYTATLSGVYSVAVSNSSGCSMLSSKNVNVSAVAFPNGTILGPAIQYLCPNGTISLQAIGGATYKWFRNGVQIPNETSNILKLNSAGDYSVALVNETGCETPVIKHVLVQQIQKPVANFTTDASCTNVEINFKSTSNLTGSGPVSYQWSDLSGNTVFAGEWPLYTFKNPGTYSVKLKVTPYFCPIAADSIVKQLLIESPRPGIQMTAVDVAVNEPVQLQARNFGNSYLWTPARFLSSSTVSNPIINTASEQRYLIQIGVPSGCITMDSLLVRVHNANTVYLPTVFSPNGDGLNDKLLVNYVGIREIKYFRVFNRWGNKVFETRNMFDGWDGTSNGFKQPMESYNWVVEAIDINGKIINKQGTVTLLR